MTIMNNEPIIAPARPAEASELRESTFMNSAVLNLFWMTPCDASWSAHRLVRSLSCCWSSGRLRSMLPLSQTSTLASASRFSRTVLPMMPGSSATRSRSANSSPLVTSCRASPGCSAASGISLAIALVIS
jgi:hypothetical protein